MPRQHGVVGPVPPGRDAAEYDRLRRRVMWRFPSGLYLVGGRVADERNLMTANWVTQVATEPKLVAVGVEDGAVTARLIAGGGHFSVSLLARADRALARTFAKPVSDRVSISPDGRVTMAGELVFEAVTGAPVLERAAAWIDCALRHELALGSHRLFVGEVVDAGFGVPPPEDGGIDGTGTVDGGDDASGGPLSPEDVPVLRMEDTRMSYGG